MWRGQLARSVPRRQCFCGSGCWLGPCGGPAKVVALGRQHRRSGRGCGSVFQAERAVCRTRRVRVRRRPERRRGRAHVVAAGGRHAPARAPTRLAGQVMAVDSSDDALPRRVSGRSGRRGCRRGRHRMGRVGHSFRLFLHRIRVACTLEAKMTSSRVICAFVRCV